MSSKHLTRAKLVFAGALLFGLGVVQASSFGCTSARFPYCEKDDDCKDKGNAKLCYDLRCVQCRYDADCGDGRFCERKVGVCHEIDATRERTSETASPSASAPSP